MDDSRLDARRELIESNRTWSTLETVAEAVSVASQFERHLYVERRADLFRWGLIHRGGGYPLLRITARVLGVDHHRILVGFRSLPDGTALLCEDPDRMEEPDEWKVIDVPVTITASKAAELIAAAVTTGLGTG
jgi:hypothetical protein